MNYQQIWVKVYQINVIFYFTFIPTDPVDSDVPGAREQHTDHLDLGLDKDYM